MPASDQAALSILMSMTDIADLAEVQRPVVTTWRRRHADFPQPVGGDPSSWLFDPTQVAEWLVARGTIGTERAGQELALYKLTGAAGRYRGPDFIAAVTSLVCLRYLIDENEPLAEDDAIAAVRHGAAVADPDDALLLSEVRAIPAAAAWLVPLVDELVEAAWGCRGAFERVMGSRHRFRAGALTATAVMPELAKLIAEVSGARELARHGELVVVADPTAGSGDLLVAVAGLLGPDESPVFSATEADPALNRLMRRRLVVHGIPRADITSAATPDAPDVVVTHIGYQPGEERDPLFALVAVDKVALGIRDGRYGVILGPAAALSDDLVPYSEAERARAKLLAGDMVEAIVRLPGGVIPFMPGYETALWVLTQARDSRWHGRVLVADVSDRPLTADVVTGLADDLVTWRREGYTPRAHSRVYAVEMPVSELVNPPRSLLPSSRQPVSPLQRKSAADYRINVIADCGAQLDRIGATATADRRHIPVERLAAADRTPVSDTIGSLVRNRRLTMKKGIRIVTADLHPSGKHPVLGSEEVLGRRESGERRMDAVVFADGYPNARLTEPGDVLVTLTPQAGAMVDHSGFAIVEYPVRILRIPAEETQQFRPRVLAAFLFCNRTGDRPAGAVRPSRDLMKQRVPLLAEPEVKWLDELLTEIDARRELATREINLLDALQQASTRGIIDGTLTLGQ
jgi:hypothetical protein